MAAYDTVSEIRTWLGIAGTTYDGFLAQSIDFFSELADDWCGRPRGAFAGTYSVSEIFYVSDYAQGVQLSQWPVTAITAFTDDDIAISADDYDIFEKEGWIQFVGSSGMPYDRSGRLVITYSAGYQETPQGVLNFIRRGTSYLFQRRMAEGVGADLIADTQITFRPWPELSNIFLDTAGQYRVDI